MAAAKIDGIHWKSALHEYVHVHNTLKPHARLGITPFELLVGWKHRGTFPSLWDCKLGDTIDRNNVRDLDATTKLQSKKYADARRGAKPSNISVGDIVLIAVTKKAKTDPSFSTERFTVLSRDGAKVVVRSDRGVQYTRSINDLKRAPLNSSFDTEKDGSGPECSAEDDYLDDVARPKATIGRPVRSTRKPERFQDMWLYNIFQ